MQTRELCRRWNVASSLVLFLLCVATTVWAQARQGEIHLQIKDPSGAPMQASGTLASVEGGVAREFQTDAQGMVVLGNLPFGRYRVQVSKSGFTTQSVAIEVHAATPVSRSISLAIGAQATKVDVVSETPLAGTDLQINQIAAPVQTATAADVENSGALDLADFMNRRLNG